MKNKGFTLLEVMLVLVIASVLLTMMISYSQQKVLSMQVDRSALQMQQILNAGMAYYVNNGKWPAGSGTTAIGVLQTGGYLPTTATSGTIPSPWGAAYTLASTNNILTVTLTFPATLKNGTAIAQLIAGKLPLATIGTPAAVSASVNIPGQDLNNANAVNFAGLYHHGGCIPAPTCPVDVNGTKMTPQVFVVPVSVSGFGDNGSTSNVYPLSSFTAYATAKKATPDNCVSTTSPPATCGASATSPSGEFWRACVDIVTDRGNVNGQNTSQWGQYVTVAAFTRCSISGEPSGSDFNVFTN